MAQPRPQPFVWVTWVSRLLAGDAQCLWAAWFKAHYTYTPLPSGFDQATWQVEHTALLAAEADRLAADGWAVLREGQNAFRLQGRSGIVLAGGGALPGSRRRPSRSSTMARTRVSASAAEQRPAYSMITPKSRSEKPTATAAAMRSPGRSLAIQP